MKPTLVAIDSRARIARRYWPKPDGLGFMVQEAELCAPEDQDGTLAAVIEQFRRGKLVVQPTTLERA